MFYEITFSPTGGTKKVCDLLVGEIANATEIDLLKEIDEITLKEEDVCFIAIPSFGGRVPNVALKRIAKIHANGARAILVCVYGNRAYEGTLVELKDTCDKVGFISIGAVAAIAKHSIVHEIAENRPDEEDKIQLKRFAKQISDKLDLLDYSIVELSGETPKKESKGLPLHPSADEDCNECGLCAKECPVSAISLENLKKCDGKKCIACMRCIAVCPKQARKVNPIAYAGVKTFLSAVAKDRKENELFL